MTAPGPATGAHTEPMWSVSGRITSAAPLVAWLCAGAALAGSAVAVLLLADADQPHAVPWKQLVLPVVWAVPGALIAAGRPRSPIGWLMLAVAVFFVGAGLSQAWVAHALSGGTAHSTAWAVWFTDRFSAFLVPFVLLTLLLLPDGRLPSRSWRVPVGCVLGVQCAALVMFNLVRGPAAGPDSSFPARVLELANPVGILPPGVGDLISGYDALLLQVPMLLGPLGFLVKLRNAVGAERTRMVGVLLAATVFVLTVVLGHALWPAASDVLDIAGSLLFATVLTASVLGRRLDQIDYAVHHTFVYAVLTVLVAALYVAVATVSSRWGASLPPFGAGVVAALLALALLPLRARLQGAVGTLMYGDRADPYHALSRLAESTHDAPSPHNVLVALATSISRSLRVPWVSVRAGDHCVEQ